MSPWLSDLVLKSQSDERLVILARAGYDRAFAVIVERYKQRLLSLAVRLGAGSRAEDVVQQSLLSAFTALRDQTEVRHLSGWLHQIVRNATIGNARTAEPESELLPETPCSGDVEEQVGRRLEAQTLLAELARLPERQRAALVLTSLHGRSRSDVALSLGMSEGAVRQMVHRARTALRSAAAALVPFPLVAWAARGGTPAAVGARTALRGSARSTAAASAHAAARLPVGAGAASAGGGIALKAGALLATTGLVAAAVAVSHQLGHRSHGTPASKTKLALAQNTHSHRATPAFQTLGRLPASSPGHPPAHRVASTRMAGPAAPATVAMTPGGHREPHARTIPTNVPGASSGGPTNSGTSSGARSQGSSPRRGSVSGSGGSTAGQSGSGHNDGQGNGQGDGQGDGQAPGGGSGTAGGDGSGTSGTSASGNSDGQGQGSSGSSMGSDQSGSSTSDNQSSSGSGDQ